MMTDIPKFICDGESKKAGNPPKYMVHVPAPHYFARQVHLSPPCQLGENIVLLQHHNKEDNCYDQFYYQIDWWDSSEQNGETMKKVVKELQQYIDGKG